MAIPRIALTRSERAAAIELTASELERIAARVRKLDADDRSGMRDCGEMLDIVQGSLALLADDSLAEQQRRERGGLAS